jgi:hypothetical protein
MQKVSGFAAGVSFGAADFTASRDWRHAVQAGKDAAAGARAISSTSCGKPAHDD